MASSSSLFLAQELCTLTDPQSCTPPLSQASVHSPFYTFHVQAISLPDDTSLTNFISDGSVFPIPSLLRTLWLGPALTLLGRVFLSNGWVLACSREHSWVHSAAERFRDYGKSQHTAGARFHCTLASLSQYQQTWLLSRVCWTFACGEAVWPLPNALQGREPLLPVWPTDHLDLTAYSWGFTLFPHQSSAGY